MIVFQVEMLVIPTVSYYPITRMKRHGHVAFSQGSEGSSPLPVPPKNLETLSFQGFLLFLFRCHTVVRGRTTYGGVAAYFQFAEKAFAASAPSSLRHKKHIVMPLHWYPNVKNAKCSWHQKIFWHKKATWLFTVGWLWKYLFVLSYLCHLDFNYLFSPFCTQYRHESVYTAANRGTVRFFCAR